HRTERAARAAPRRPEVDHDGYRARALDDLALEVGIADVDDPRSGGHAAVSAAAPVKTRPGSRPGATAGGKDAGARARAASRWRPARSDRSRRGSPRERSRDA